MEFLLSPIDATRTHEVGFLISWHGRFTVLAWAVLLPVGILIARFTKILPSFDWPNKLDNKLWWYSHLFFQYTGSLVLLVGIVLIYIAETSGEWHWHRILGWITVALCVFQVFSGVVRGTKGGPTEPAADGSWRGDHYDMTLHRRIFEYFHKTCGYSALFISIGAVISGLWYANAPVWMWIVLPIWWSVLIAAFIILQRKGMAYDTYQAIWGPSDEHPGNRMKAIGWGVKRFPVIKSGKPLDEVE